MSVSRSTPPGHDSASARASANSTGRRASEIQVAPARRPRRQASTTSAPEPSSASTSSRRSDLLAACRDASRRRAIERAARLGDLGEQRRHLARARPPPCARSSAARASAVRSERSATSAAASSATARSDGGRPRASRPVSAAPASSMRPSSSSRRTAISRACSALPRSPRAASVAAAAASARGEPPRSRIASATSASATTQRARASSSCAPKPRAARLMSSRARAMLAELRHRDAAQRERRRVLAQADALERAERVAGGEGARGGRDQGVHQSMTRSAWSSSAAGIVKRRMAAVLRLITISTRVGCSMGRSPGFAPLKILSTKIAVMRIAGAGSTP